MKRYTLLQTMSSAGDAYHVMDQDDCGAWVRYADVERLREHAERLAGALLNIMMQPGEPDVMDLGYIEASFPRVLLIEAKASLAAYRRDYPKEEA